MKIWYYGPEAGRPQPNDQGELRIVSFNGLLERIEKERINGGILALAYIPFTSYLVQADKVGAECLLCNAALLSRLSRSLHTIGMMVFALPAESTRYPVLVSALCCSCCDNEPNDTKLLEKVEVILQREQILG